MQICFSTASLPNRPLPEILSIGQRLGFKAVELLAFDGYRHRLGWLAGFYWDRLSPAQRDELARMTAQFDHIALHAPFIDTRPISPDPAIREASVIELQACIEAARILGAKVITTHAAPPPHFSYAEVRPRLVSLYRTLADAAAEADVRIGIETGWPPPEQMVDLVSAIHHPMVGITVDVGHLRGLLAPADRESQDGPAIYNELVLNHIRTAGRYIVHVHVHDVRVPDWRDHVALGQGILDFRAVLQELQRAKYEGLLSFELEAPQDEEALAKSKALLEELLQQV